MTQPPQIDWKEQINRTQRVMAKNISERLYGDNPLFNDMLKNQKPPSFSERVKAFFDRARNAWLVLTGKLDPYDY